MASRFVDEEATLADVSSTTSRDAEEMTSQELQVNILCTSVPGVRVLGMIRSLCMTSDDNLPEKQRILDIMRPTFPTIDYDGSQFSSAGPGVVCARIAFGDSRIEPVVVRFDTFDDALVEGFRRHTALQSDRDGGVFLLPVIAQKVLWISGDRTTIAPVIATFYRAGRPLLLDVTDANTITLSDGKRYVWGMRAE